MDDRNPAFPYNDPKLVYGNYGIVLIMGNAGFISSTVGSPVVSFALSISQSPVLKPSIGRKGTHGPLSSSFLWCI